MQFQSVIIITGAIYSDPTGGIQCCDCWLHANKCREKFITLLVSRHILFHFLLINIHGFLSILRDRERLESSVRKDLCYMCSCQVVEEHLKIRWGSLSPVLHTKNAINII